MHDILIAAFLGLVEGLTEFIPVSSTGHLVLLVDLLKFPAPPGRIFEVFIQMGAILAVMVLFRERILSTICGLPREEKAQKFALNIIAGTIPALIAGALAHEGIKGMYRPEVIAASLIAGGIAILFLERRSCAAKIQSLEDISWRTALLIGCCQAVALVPGVSRSGATIMGSLFMGLSRPVAAEFSFFRAMPVMVAAVTFDLFENWQALKLSGDFELLLTGFLAAFVMAMLTVKMVMRFIGRTGFTPFAWYRIALGLLVFAFIV